MDGEEGGKKYEAKAVESETKLQFKMKKFTKVPCTNLPEIDFQM